MAAKDNPVIDLMEEEEEEWPEVGAQNPEEAEWYTEKINNVFDHLSELIHQDTKMALGQTIQKFKKIVVSKWATMEDADVDIILKTIKDPTAMYLWQHLTSGAVEVVDPLKNCQQDRSFYDSCQNGPGGPKKQRSLWISSNMRHGLMSICQKFVPM